jgi:chromosome segregation ATPase
LGVGVELVKFEELENKIRNLLSEHSLLKKRNQELEELLKNKGLELEESSIKIRGLNEERNSIRTKVDSLLDLLQDINVPK